METHEKKFWVTSRSGSTGRIEVTLPKFDSGYYKRTAENPVFARMPSDYDYNNDPSFSDNGKPSVHWPSKEDFEPIKEEWLLSKGFLYSTEPVPDDKNPFGSNYGYDFYTKGGLKFQSCYVIWNDKTLSLSLVTNHGIHCRHKLEQLYLILTGEEL